MGSLFTWIYNSRISGALNKVYNYRHKDNLDDDDDADEEVEKKVVDEDNDDCVAFDGDDDDISVHMYVHMWWCSHNQRQSKFWELLWESWGIWGEWWRQKKMIKKRVADGQNMPLGSL